MNKPIERNTGSGTTKTTNQAQKTGSTNSSPTFRKPEPTQNTKAVTPEVVNKYTGKEPAKEPFVNVTAKDATMESKAAIKDAAKLGAAKGDDDAMSQPQPAKPSNSVSAPGISTSEELVMLWNKQISAAKSAWTKLTENELQTIEGHANKLIDLVQKRYVLTREEADKQVRSFFEKFMPSHPSVGEQQGNWKQHVGAAKIAWGKLTEDELLKTEGQALRLAGLVQARYAIHRDEAELQVKTFLEKNKA